MLELIETCNILTKVGGAIVILLFLLLFTFIFFRKRWIAKAVILSIVAFVLTVGAELYFNHQFIERVVDIAEYNLDKTCVSKPNTCDFYEVNEITVTDGRRLYPIKFVISERDNGETIITFYTPTNINDIWKKVESKPLL